MLMKFGLSLIFGSGLDERDRVLLFRLSLDAENSGAVRGPDERADVGVVLGSVKCEWRSLIGGSCLPKDVMVFQEGLGGALRYGGRLSRMGREGVDEDNGMFFGCAERCHGLARGMHCVPDVSRKSVLPVLAFWGDVGVRTSFAGAINPFEAEGNVSTVHEG